MNIAPEAQARAKTIKGDWPVDISAKDAVPNKIDAPPDIFAFMRNTDIVKYSHNIDNNLLIAIFFT